MVATWQMVKLLVVATGRAVNELGTYFRHHFSSAGEKCNMSARVPPTPTGGISLRISHRFLLIADEVIGRPGTNL